jgi:RNA polymerase sigma factor (sigma-70 family)
MVPPPPQQHDHHWLVQAFDDHYDAIYAYLARRVGRSTAEDLTGEVFAVAFYKAHRFDRDRGSAIAWLFGIANNMVRNHRRKERRQLAAYARHGSSEVDVLVDSRIMEQENRALLAQALQQLKPDARDILLLATWGGLTYQQISEALSIPIGTVRSRLSRARDDVRDLLEHQNKIGASALTAKDAQ